MTGSKIKRANPEEHLMPSKKKKKKKEQERQQDQMSTITQEEKTIRKEIQDSKQNQIQHQDQTSVATTDTTTTALTPLEHPEILTFHIKYAENKEKIKAFFKSLNIDRKETIVTC